MRVLLDECVPWQVHQVLVGHVCTTVQRRGWGAMKNGELLASAEGEFDVFVTADQNLQYQQALAGRRIAIVELSTNKLRRLVLAAEAILKAVADSRPGGVDAVGNPLRLGLRTLPLPCCTPGV